MFGEIVPFNAKYAVFNKSFDFNPLECFEKFTKGGYSVFFNAVSWLMLYHPFSFCVICAKGTFLGLFLDLGNLPHRRSCGISGLRV
jgi:hypothetical protein